MLKALRFKLGGSVEFATEPLDDDRSHSGKEFFVL